MMMIKHTVLHKHARNGIVSAFKKKTNKQKFAANLELVNFTRITRLYVLQAP